MGFNGIQKGFLCSSPVGFVLEDHVVLRVRLDSLLPLDDFIIARLEDWGVLQVPWKNGFVRVIVRDAENVKKIGRDRKDTDRFFFLATRGMVACQNNLELPTPEDRKGRT